jgi:integrase
MTLTRDNHHLSEPKPAPSGAERFGEINCANDPGQPDDSGRSLAHAMALQVSDRSPDLVAQFVRDSLAANTRRAYRFDLQRFEEWGGRIPCDAHVLASYLAENAGRLAVATLVRRVAAITRAHEALNYTSPARSDLVRATLRGIRRQFGVRRQEAKPLLREDLFRVLDAIGDGMKEARDRALLLVGFAGGLRRSEIIALNAADIEPVRQGLIVHLRRSKTDQEGAGRKIGIPFGRTRFCPVTALQQWRERSRVTEGPIFRPVDRHGRIAPERLSAEAVSSIIKERVGAAGFDPNGYSGHSLRAGFATSAAQAGISSWRIRQQTGHASDAMLARYIRDSELFIDNAAGALL